MSSYLAVDPSQLAIPTDSKDVFTCLEEIKNILLAMNHNLATFMGSAGPEVQNLGATVATHATSLGNLNNLMVQALAAGSAAASGTRGGQSS